MLCKESHNRHSRNVLYHGLWALADDPREVVCRDVRVTCLKTASLTNFVFSSLLYRSLTYVAIWPFVHVPYTDG